MADYCEQKYIETGQSTQALEDTKKYGAKSGQRGVPGEHAGHGHAGAPGQTDAAPGRDGGQRQSHLSGV